MKRSTERVLVGSAVAAAGVLVLGTAMCGVSRYLVRLALDRQGPKRIEKKMTRVSGNAKRSELLRLAAESVRRLEKVDCETVELRSHDGLRLVGHWHPCEDPKRILVAMHGWRSSWRRDFGMISGFWHENDCAVLYAEQRGQGGSDGAYMGFGMLERRDCLSWAQWVTAQCGDIPVYLVGLSMGATTVLMAGGMELPPNVRGIIADCGFTSANEIWKHVAQKNLHLHYGLCAASANALCRKRLCLDARDYSTVDAMQECEVPVLFIHGTDDRFVPITMTYENYKACAAPKRLFVVPGADHAMSYCVDQAGYEKAVLDFWAELEE